MWPHEPDVAQIVLLDHHMVPTTADVEEWVEAARRRPGAPPREIRTGALFPDAAECFRRAGFETIDTLALLQRPLAPMSASTRRIHGPGRRVRVRRLRPSHLPEVAELDRVAFGDPWGNDAESLRGVSEATKHHRGRMITARGLIVAFALSGHSARCGYLQRLAVHPDAQGQGLGSALVADSLSWMQRRGASRALVNTGITNDSALRLYQRFGFERQPETLSILARSAR